jgi:hypothetical protein
MRHLIILFPLFLATSPDTLAGKKKEPPLIPGVQVVLRCSTERLDPLAPGKHELECVVRNGSDKALEVPLGYEGGFRTDVSLIATGPALHWPLNLVSWGSSKERKTAVVKAGKELVIFKETLADMLLLNVKEEEGPPLIPGVKRWYWSWIA